MSDLGHVLWMAGLVCAVALLVFAVIDEALGDEPTIERAARRAAEEEAAKSLWRDLP